MITQPQEDPKVPAKLKKHVEKVRNMVTMQEIEYKRLKGLVEAEKYQLDALLKQKAELEEQVKVQSPRNP